MVKTDELRSSAYTTTYYRSIYIRDTKSAVRWFHHVLTLEFFEDIYIVQGGETWKNDTENAGDKFSPEESTESMLLDYTAKKNPHFLCVSVNYDGTHCVIGVDLMKNRAYVMMRNRDLPELPWLLKLLPE